MIPTEAEVPKGVRQQPGMSDEESDEMLVALALRDRRAFGILYDRYVERIYRYCRGRLRDREDAEDATSLVFARALAALPTHQGPSFRSWLFVIAHNVVLNARRNGSTDQPLAVALDVVDLDAPLEDRVLLAERRRSLSQALGLLPEEQRRVVELRLAGLTGPEVAATLGRSHDSVRATQRRALAQLRTLLGITPESAEGRHAS
jgi:RNA polymerase sigma-70 factor, ECF subfamily